MTKAPTSPRGGRREWLVVVAKAPVAGEVKTRLEPELGAEGAARVARCFLEDSLGLARRVADARPSVGLAIAAAGLRASRDVLDGIDLTGFMLLAQLGPSLGTRLTSCFDMLFGDGNELADSVVAIGADSPNLPGELVQRAFELLAEGGPDHVVLGPAADGGYYLIGMNRLQPALFVNVPWSTPTVLAETVRAAGKAGLTVAHLPAWYDVDTPEDLARLRSDLRERPEAAPRTAKHLLG